MKCRSLPFLLLLFWMLSGITLKGQSFQIGYRVLTADFDPTIRFAPYNENIPVASGVGVHVLFPYTKYFGLGGDARVGKMNNIDSEVTNLRSEDLFIQTSFIARVQNFRPKKWFRPFLQAGVGLQNLRKESRWSPSIGIGAGLDIEVVEGLSLGFSSQYTRELSRNRYFVEYALGMTGSFGYAASEEELLLESLVDDNDGDGIPNDQDHCPEVSGGVFTNGCPDQDEDGVADIYDQCPNDPGLAAYEGCPISNGDQRDVAEKKKEDFADEGNRIAGDQDERVREINPMDSVVEEPIIATENPAGLSEADYDGDNIPDRLDECPEVFGKLELNGCPEPDRDNDGVIDKEDHCPEVAGSLYHHGCPEDVMAANESKEPEGNQNGVDSAGVSQGSEAPSTESESEGPLEEASEEVAQVEPGTEVLVDRNKEEETSEKLDEVLNNKEQFQQEASSQDASEPLVQKASRSDENPNSNSSDEGSSLTKDIGTNEDNASPSPTSDHPSKESSPEDKESTETVSTNEVATKTSPDTVVIIKTEEKIKTVIQEKVVRIDDNDGDGIANSIDRCPDLFGSIKNEGCPEQGAMEEVVNVTDNSRAQPEQNTNVILSNPGISNKERFALSPVIHFQQGVAALQSQYVDELEEIATFMRLNPEYDLKIYGHTDSKGSDYINQILSERRAKTCYLFLNLTAKIAKERMSYHGEGEYAPISDNYTSQGRWKNRRVVFDFIRR